ncbi:MAG TPA: UvrD-helicase domain-containing protein [Myxococcota bacterium]|nr:UvrD-helicase domain-containing protein [Myxococcota bacterium]HRY93156.1 UvrD-helicase domain-containing protein [Myxococcota bacterium]HSA21919.1 UvrD-helicase domain-containing protein [Myxococcota bacterium]
MDLAQELNPEQLEAARHGRGPLLILAGAGSGKTRVLTYRIARLLGEERVPAWSVLAVTFTNKAAGEMRERVARLTGAGGRDGPWVLTFHAFGARVLRRHAELLGWNRDFVIYDEDDVKRLGRRLLDELDLDPERYKVEKVLAAVERAKRSLKGHEHRGLEGPLKAFYGRYQEHLRRANAFDFSDLIYQPNRLFDRHPEVLEEHRRRFRHVLVDEFQDTDAAQYRILKLLCPPAERPNLCVVGDDDQSIYGWRGAHVQNILGFAHDFPGCKVVKLEQNYRSTGRILEAAHAVVARIPRRHPKKLWTEAPAGEPPCLRALEDEREEAELVVLAVREGRDEGVPLAEAAVFYRTNAQSRALEEALRRWAVPYRVVGGTRFFDRLEIRDLMAYLRLLSNPQSDIDLLRALNTPARGLGERTRERLAAQATRLGCSLWDALQPERLPDEVRKAEAERLLGFRALVEGLRREAEGRPASEVVRLAIDRSGYGEALSRQATEEAQGRLENLEELVSAAADFAGEEGDEGLPAFLEHVALLTDVDELGEDADALTLMTLHAAKGLEFDHVFMVGMEDGLLPHRRSLVADEERELGLQEPEDDRAAGLSLEEERRLCYVGMTRARKRLWLTWARSRTIFGRTELHPPSRFLADVAGYDEARAGAGAAAGRGELVDLTDYDLDDEDEVFDGDRFPGQVSPAADGDSVVDYGEDFDQTGEARRRSAEGPEGWIGRSVEHASFGRGRVLGAAPVSQGLKLIVEFATVGKKTVLASFVRRAR